MTSESSVRSVKKDELLTFLKQDKIDNFENLCQSISTGKLGDDVLYYVFGDKLFIQSKEIEENTGIMKFCFCILNDFSLKHIMLVLNIVYFQ